LRKEKQENLKEAKSSETSDPQKKKQRWRIRREDSCRRCQQHPEIVIRRGSGDRNITTVALIRCWYNARLDASKNQRRERERGGRGKKKKIDKGTARRYAQELR
jgi:hypothetical protein